MGEAAQAVMQHTKYNNAYSQWRCETCRPIAAGRAARPLLRRSLCGSRERQKGLLCFLARFCAAG